MAKRKRIAIIYSYNENWIGGTYYIQNLIYSLKTLSDKEKPFLIVYANDKDFDNIQNIDYPYIKIKNYTIKYNIFERVINKISRFVLKTNYIIKEPNKKNLDVLFPVIYDNYFFRMVPENQKIYWIPDFQEHYLPDFFSNEEIQDRKKYQLSISEKSTNIIFSSNDAMKDFKKFYPKNQNKLFVVNFAVKHPDYKLLNINNLKQKYKIDTDYFFSPNQFWQHKNHKVILEAVKILKQKNISIKVVFTGKEEDYRNPDYFDSLKKFVEENNLKDNIFFLGFIDRKEQLQLMNNSLAVIQPSLFEGWSTVVEDAKAMQKFIILSNLEVHKEQINENALFFDPVNPNDLANQIITFLYNKIEITPNKYEFSLFGKKFMEVINKIM